MLEKFEKIANAASSLNTTENSMAVMTILDIQLRLMASTSMLSSV